VTPAGSNYTAGQFRAPITEINSKLEKLADNNKVFYMDIGSKFLTAERCASSGCLRRRITPHR